MSRRCTTFSSTQFRKDLQPSINGVTALPWRLQFVKAATTAWGCRLMISAKVQCCRPRAKAEFLPTGAEMLTEVSNWLRALFRGEIWPCSPCRRVTYLGEGVCFNARGYLSLLKYRKEELAERLPCWGRTDKKRPQTEDDVAKVQASTGAPRVPSEPPWALAHRGDDVCSWYHIQPNYYWF